MRPRQPPPSETAAEPPAALRAAVSQLRRALAGYPVELPDREVAEEQLATLDAMAAAGIREPARLRQALLLTVSAVGSISALAGPLDEVRAAVALFGDPPQRGR